MLISRMMKLKLSSPTSRGSQAWRKARIILRTFYPSANEDILVWEHKDKLNELYDDILKDTESDDAIFEMLLCQKQAEEEAQLKD